MSSLHIRTLLRAAEIAGGVEQLAARLGLPPTMLVGYISGYFEVPQYIFLKCTEILTDAEVTDAAFKAKRDSPLSQEKK